MGAAQLGRKIAPVEVAKVIAFLLSDDALIIRGQAINVDGGDTPTDGEPVGQRAPVRGGHQRMRTDRV